MASNRDLLIALYEQLNSGDPSGWEGGKITLFEDFEPAGADVY